MMSCLAVLAVLHPQLQYANEAIYVTCPPAVLPLPVSREVKFLGSGACANREQDLSCGMLAQLSLIYILIVSGTQVGASSLC